ncbi:MULTISPECIES: hypothetical protein [Cupriavidus]
MSAIKIIHFAQTPLVAAPAKIAAATRMRGHHAHAVALVDYPNSGGLAGKFINDTILLQDAPAEIVKLAERMIARADIIHVHNEISLERADWLLEIGSRARFVYQVHSPLREGPLYIPRAEVLGLPFSAHLVVGQYQPRHYQNYRPVPNIILDEPSCIPRREGEKLRVMFSPTHSRGGRWNAKYSQELEAAVNGLLSAGLIETVWPEKPVSPNVLMALRRTCHVSIDEIVTGAFHQVSVEGLCAGNVVINRADYFSKAMMACCAGAKDLPPFVYADERSIAGILVDLARDWKFTAKIQEDGFLYFNKYLRPRNLVSVFMESYHDVLR